MHAATLALLLVLPTGIAVWAPAVFPAYEWCDVEVRGLAFATPATGLAVGTCMSVYRTLDGGGSWVRDPTTGDLGHLNDVAFGGGTFGVAVGQNAIFQAAALRTNDAGASFAWSSFYLYEPAEPIDGAPVGNEGQLTGVAILSDTVAVATAAVWNGEGAIVRTTDGGATWRSVLWHGFAFRDVDLWGGILVAVGDAGSVFTSADGGVTWAQRSSGVAVRLLAVDDGIAVGEAGIAIRSQDGGATWLPVATGVAVDLRDVSVHGGTIHVAGLAGTIRSSTDGGLTWAPEPALSVVDLNTLAFPAPGVGLAGGTSTVLRQLDATAVLARTN